MDLDVAQPIEVDRNQVGCAAVDSQSLVSAVGKAGRIEDMHRLTVNDIGGTRTRIQYRAVTDRDSSPRIAEKHLRQRVHIVHGALHGRDVVVHAAGDDVASIIVGELARVRGREVDPAVDGGWATVSRLAGVGDPDVAVDRDVSDLERVTAGPLEENGVILATPKHERRHCPL